MWERDGWRLVEGLGLVFGLARCLGCGGASAETWCQPCAGAVERVRADWCAVCGLPRGPLCPGCRLDLRLLTSIRAALLYRGAARDLILRMKVGPSPQLCRPLGRVLAAVPHPPTVDLVVPVPASRAGLQARRFNPAALLARPVARATRVRFRPCALGRRSDRPRASSLRRRRDRHVQLRRAFFVPHPRAVADRDILLVDDVLTSGATALSCATALKKAGARAVHLLVLARTPLSV